MFSAGQTQNVQASTTLQAIASLACQDGSNEARSQCAQRVTDVYTTNVNRVPENLKAVFEGFAYVAANTIFKLCPADSSNALCSNGGINMWGGTYLFTDFLAKLADLLGGCPSRHSSVYWELHQDEYRRFLECHRAEQEELHDDGTDNGRENGMPFCGNLTIAETSRIPCDNEGRCRPVLTAGELQQTLRQIRNAYPDDPQTSTNESDEAVNNYLARPICEEDDSAAQSSLPCCDDANATVRIMELCNPNCTPETGRDENNAEAGVNCDTLNDADWARNAESCMRCGRTVCEPAEEAPEPQPPCCSEFDATSVQTGSVDCKPGC